MKNITTIAVIVATLVSGAAFAAPTAELKVTGVIKPPACTPTFSGGGVVDYGNIPASSLTAGQYKILDKKQVSFQVSCDAPTKIAFTLADNRASSQVTGILASLSPNMNEDYNFGLGIVAGKKVGGYAMALDTAVTTADGVQVDNIFSNSNGSSWGVAGALDRGVLFSVAAKGTKQPIAVKQLNATINVRAVLNKPENLPLSQDVPLDGSTTIEVKYL